MTKIRWKKKLDTMAGLIAFGIAITLSSNALAQMQVTYKRSGAPLAKKPAPVSTPLKITYINKKTKKKVVSTSKRTAPQLISIVSTDTQTSTLGFTPEVMKPVEKKWGVSSSMTYTRLMVDQQDGSMAAYMDFTAGGSYKFDSVKLTATLLASRDMIAEETTADDFLIGASLNSTKLFNENLTITPFSTIGPAVAKSDQFASLKAKTKFGLKMALNSEKLGMGKFGIDGSVDVRKNFHEYTSARDGKINTEWSSLQVVGANYGFTEKLSVAMNLIHFNSWSYNGIQAEYFSHSQELSYAMTKSLNISGGHQMGYPFVTAFKANGTDRNFDLFNDKDSYIFAALSVSY